METLKRKYENGVRMVRAISDDFWGKFERLSGTKIKSEEADTAWLSGVKCSRFPISVIM